MTEAAAPAQLTPGGYLRHLRAAAGKAGLLIGLHLAGRAGDLAAGHRYADAEADQVELTLPELEAVREILPLLNPEIYFDLAAGASPMCGDCGARLTDRCPASGVACAWGRERAA